MRFENARRWRILWFLGASPDGLTESGKIVEVKCPYTLKIQQKTRCLEHYSQIQTLLEVFDLEVCDFVQFKPAGKGTGHSGDVSRPKMLIECVKRDHVWFAGSLSPGVGERLEETPDAVVRRKDV